MEPLKLWLVEFLYISYPDDYRRLFAAEDKNHLQRVISAHYGVKEQRIEKIRCIGIADESINPGMVM